MPFMKMLATKTVSTKLGHMLSFVANEPLNVPWDAVPDCQAAGAVVVDEDGLTDNETAGHKSFAIASDLRRSIVLRVMQDIIARNDPAEFDAGGAPKLESIHVRSQLTTDAGERDELHVLLKKAAAEKNFEIVFHKATDAAMEAIEANTRDDVMRIAKKRGLKKADLDKLMRTQLPDARVMLIGYMGDYSGD